MALSRCPRESCNGRTFEAKKLDHIQGSNYKHIAIQCSTCGAVVGVMDYWNIGSLLHSLAEKLHVKIS